jgi:RNA polymerase sigma-70 factor (ECF subfamily)
MIDDPGVMELLETGGGRDDLLAARAGDEGAAHRLVGRHGASMLRAARRVLGGVDPRDAEDAVQEAFVASLVTEALPTGDPAPWLRAIAVRKALDLARGRARRREESLLPAEEGGPEPTVAPAAPGFVDAGMVRQALGRLQAADRAILVLVDLEGFSMKEAAEMLGTNRVAARVRAVRARRRLARLLGAVPENGGKKK